MALSSSSPLSHQSDNLLRKTLKSLQSKPDSVILLDGGTGETLFRDGGVPDDRKIWSAIALVHAEYHSALENVHSSFLHSGAKVITTNSYGVVPGVGFTQEEMTKHINEAGRIARKAVDKFQAGQSPDIASPRFVLGSLGPLIESYRPDMILPPEQGVFHYQTAIHALEPHVDGYLGETLSCVPESLQIVQALQAVTRKDTSRSSRQCPLLLSFTLDPNGDFRDGQPLTQGLRELLEFVPGKCGHNSGVDLLAILFNCSEPEAITLGLEKIHADPPLRYLFKDAHVLLGAYANRLTQVDPNWTLQDSVAPQPFRKDLDVEKYWEHFISKWISDFNVQLVGGCCGWYPEHIAFLRDKLDARKTQSDQESNVQGIEL